jgi:phosphatidylglycerol:prolipoprotein diacylglycerol transferase
MCPFLNLKYIKIPMYGLMILLGVFIASFISYILCKKRKKSFDDFIIISVLTFSFGFVFAKILFLLVSYPLRDFFKIVFYILFKSKNNEINSGFVFYGGLIGGPLGFYLGLKITKAKFEDFIDLFAFLIPFVHSFGRLGCFFAGCCYGKLYDGIFSVIYKNPISDVPVGVKVFPVQLFESFFLLMISIIILILFLRETN